MAVYVKNPTIELKSGETRVLRISWNNAWTDLWSTQNLYNKADTVVIEEYIPGGQWYVANKQNIEHNDSQWGTKNHLDWSVSNDRVTQVRVSICPVIQSSQEGNYCASAVYGTFGSWTWPDWYRYLYWNFGVQPPTPSTPSVSQDKLKLTASISNYTDDRANAIQFQILQDNSKKPYNVTMAALKNTSSSVVVDLEPGHKYKVRCRAADTRTNGYSAKWSDFSEEIETIPSAPESIVSCAAISETSVLVQCSTVATATSYTAEWTDDPKYFDTGSSEHISSNSSTTTNIQCDGMETGKKYYFRVKATNNQGDSDWCSQIESVSIGKEPSAPTTWTLTSTTTVGKKITLYWTHNSEDGSTMKKAQIQLDVDGMKSTIDITKDLKEDEIYTYTLDTSDYKAGVNVKWKIRTKGIMDSTEKSPDGYSEWSIERVLKVYAQPTCTLNYDDVDLTIKQYPIIFKCTCGPNTQKPIGYTFSIISNMDYESTTFTGETETIIQGQELYSVYRSMTEDQYSFNISLAATDVHLENGINLTIKLDVAMDSGLTASASLPLTTSFSGSSLNMYMGVYHDKQNYISNLVPIAYDMDKSEAAQKEVLADDVVLSVYRREYNGEYTLVEKDLSNTGSTTITDPHPSLNNAMYRLVATNVNTGIIDYQNVNVEGLQEKGIIIQWNERSKTLEDAPIVSNPLSDPLYNGSLVRLPYNIKISEQNTIDSSLISYVGRKRPVSYFGTQLGESATWNCEIPKDDEDTLFSLRRLAIWTGNCYVREPSGTGYWATVAVSMNKDYDSRTIPVTLNITRVEGE